MDDFPGLLARDYGFKPQGKSAPMAPRNTNSAGSFTSSSMNFGIGSGSQNRSSSSSVPSKSAPIFDDQDHGGGDDLLFSDVFGGPPKYAESRGGGGTTTTSSSGFDYASMFKEQNAKSSSLPVYDKPVYDEEDIFDGLPGLKSTSSGSSSAKFPEVFASMATASSPQRRPQNSSPLDDLFTNLGKKETQSRKESAKVEKDSPAFDDLLPGFGRSSSPTISRSSSESNRSTKPSSNSANTSSNVVDDPFVVLDSTSTPAPASTGIFTDPLEDISRFSSPGRVKVENSSVNRNFFEDVDPLDNLGKSVPPTSPETNKRGKDGSPLRSGPSVTGSYAPTSKEPVDKYPVESAESHPHKMKPVDDFQESHESLFDMPTASTDFRRSAGRTFSPPPYENSSPNETISPPRYEEAAESSDDVWLTVSEIPLFTQPTSAPPPSRPPPSRPTHISKSDMGYSSSTNSRRKVNDYSSFSNSAHHSQSPRSSQAARTSMASPIDELEDFAMGRTQNNVNEHADFFSGADAETNSSAAAASAAAMKEAMDKAEAKIRQMREREYLKGRSRDSGQLDRDMQDVQQKEIRERQERLDRERQQREKEAEERELRRLEKERERAREIEREREEKEREQRRLERERERAREERDKGRQAVERATREARERAAADARLRAERAAVEKASAGARERAERAAVQRAQAEARERAAADARERAEKAAAEARERASAEAREKADTRARERAAVERAAAEARERAAAAARTNQQKNDNLQKNNENDLESFFSSRASSAPRPRANASDPFFDTQNKGAPEVAKRTSVAATSSMKKASSTTNIVDDLSSIFGAAGSSGEFQDVEGETEERRRARLERHQRTQERAAKALAEKNQRDLQAQMDQAERHRIGETLDAEIKRWAAGKEGNLRTLLSTLQYVLWPECGWKSVSMSELIAPEAVKKVYRKATLCIHPDKVQQKGANLQQKYVAEKVFDLLKEAWNKFNSEELF